MIAAATAIVSEAGGMSSNEDRCLHVRAEGFECWAIFDGLGGHGGGEIASQLAAEALAASFTAHPGWDLPAYFAAAHEAIVDGQSGAGTAGMRTTAVVLVSDGAAVRWAHCGDSRLYWLRDARILLRTKDHSVPQALVNAGEISEAEIRFHPDRSRLLRCLGVADEPRITIESEPRAVAPGDAFLLASDGFWEHVVETEMEDALRGAVSVDDWLGRMCAGLERETASRAVHDNYSAVAVYFGGALV